RRGAGARGAAGPEHREGEAEEEGEVEDELEGRRDRVPVGGDDGEQADADGERAEAAGGIEQVRAAPLAPGGLRLVRGDAGGRAGVEDAGLLPLRELAIEVHDLRRALHSLLV